MAERRRGWTQEDLQFIKKNYGSISLHEISSRLGRSYSSISSKIHKMELDDPRCWTLDEDALLIANYEFNPSVWDLLPNRSREAIIQRAQIFKLSRHCGNYSVNFKFFDTWSEDTAYTLGFFIADGCLEPNLNRISFSQRTEDVDVLYKIREAMGCHNPLCFKKTRNEVGLYIHNKYLVDRLSGLGFDNKKTLTASIPSIPEEFMPHLIRGILDGDGSIYTDNQRIRVQFLGTYSVLQEIRRFFIQKGISSNEVSKRKVNVHVLQYSKKKDVEAILSLLYVCSTIHMDRKHSAAIEVLKVLHGAFARGVTPGINNLTQNEESLPGHAAANLVGKTDLQKIRLARRGHMSGSSSLIGESRMMECSDTPRNRRQQLLRLTCKSVGWNKTLLKSVNRKLNAEGKALQKRRESRRDLSFGSQVSIQAKTMAIKENKVLSSDFSWFLGFLCSDGCLRKPKYRKKGDESHIAFCLHSRDFEVLFKIKEILKTRANPRLYEHYLRPQCSMAIYDRKDVLSDFSNIKTVIPAGIIHRDFIRGLVDGDGCLNYRIARKSFRITLINENIEIMEYVSHNIADILGIELQSPRFVKQSNFFSLEWEGKKARFIAWWLYHGAIEKQVLNRKHLLYKSYVLKNIECKNATEELFLALNNGEYFTEKRGEGLVIHLNESAQNSLLWAKRLQKLIKRSTPIPLNKGKKKYFALYIPVLDTQSIQLDEGIVQNATQWEAPNHGGLAEVNEELQVQ